MERSRTGPPTSSSETGVASLPEGLPSLEVLIEQARAPGAARAEVDALLAGLAQPLASEQSPRERADLLLALIEDKHLGDFSGSKGRTVRSAAIQALLALGYPYALEVPPDALEEQPSRTRGAGPGAPSRLFSSVKGWAGFSLITLLGLVQLIPALVVLSAFNTPAVAYMVVIAIVCATTFLPLFLVTLGHMGRKKLPRTVGNVWLVVVGLSSLAVGSLALLNDLLGLIGFVAGILVLVATALMDSVAPED